MTSASAPTGSQPGASELLAGITPETGGFEVELQRIADDAGACAHALAAMARRWRSFQLVGASLAGVLATSAGVTGITEAVHPTFSGIKALAAAAIGAAMTAMDPGRRAEDARTAAASYLQLHHRAHRVRSLDLPSLEPDSARRVVEELAQTHDGLNSEAPPLRRRSGLSTGR